MLLDEVSVVKYFVIPPGFYYDESFSVTPVFAQKLIGDGYTTKFVCNFSPTAVYINNVKQTKLTLYKQLITFNIAPLSGEVIVALPKELYTLYATGTASLLVGGSGYALSRNVITDKVGNLLLSTDGNNFQRCVEFSGSTELFFKSDLTTAYDVANLVENELVIVSLFNSQALSLNEEGEIVVSLAAPGGVEFYASSI